MWCPLLTLPVEIRHKIFTMCKKKDLRSMSLTSKHWCQETKPLLWSSVRISWKHIVSCNPSPQPVRYLKHTRKLNFTGRAMRFVTCGTAEQHKKHVRSVFAAAIQRCDALRLRTLIFHNHLVDGGLRLCSERLPNVEQLMVLHMITDSTNWRYVCRFKQLKSLSLSACNVADGHLRDIASLRNLQKLRIVYSDHIDGRFLYYASKAPSLVHLAISSLPMLVHYQKPMPCFPKLKELMLNNVSLHDDFFLDASLNLPVLESLDLCLSCFSECVLQDISSLKSLRRLFMAECSSLTDQGLFWASSMDLRMLDVWGCPKLSDVGLDYISRMKSLVTLDIGFNSSFTEVGLSYLASCTSLHKLKAEECSQLSETSVDIFNNVLGQRPTCNGPTRCNSPSCFIKKIGRKKQLRKRKTIEKIRRTDEYRVVGEGEGEELTAVKHCLGVGYYLQYNPEFAVT